MNEVVFLVEDFSENGFEVSALGQSIFTEGETMDELKENIRETVLCHFEDSTIPSAIRLHYVKDEMISL